METWSLVQTALVIFSVDTILLLVVSTYFSEKDNCSILSSAWPQSGCDRFTSSSTVFPGFLKTLVDYAPCPLLTTTRCYHVRRVVRQTSFRVEKSTNVT